MDRVWTTRAGWPERVLPATTAVAFGLTTWDPGAPADALVATAPGGVIPGAIVGPELSAPGSDGPGGAMAGGAGVTGGPTIWATAGAAEIRPSRRAHRIPFTSPPFPARGEQSAGATSAGIASQRAQPLDQAGHHLAGEARHQHVRRVVQGGRCQVHDDEPRPRLLGVDG